MRVERICLAPTSETAMQEQESIRLQAGAGIVGDRYCSLEQDYVGQNLTLIELEEIANFNAAHGCNIQFEQTRRNLATLGVRLNQLVGREFSLGSVRLRGVELCTPCETLGKNLAETGLTPAQIVKAFLNSGGLRADVLNDGEIRRGDQFQLAD